jgi:osmotically-inducible protein OsmY
MKYNLKSSVQFFLIVFSAAMIGCQTPAGKMAEQGMGNDKQLALAVSSQLNRDPLLEDMPIGVASYRHEITLSGAVNSPRQWKHAEDVARSVPGVKKVTNLLLEP